MGFAKFLGRDYGTDYTKKDMALGLFFLWAIGGLLFNFVLALIILDEPSFLLPFSFYFFGLLMLFGRYLRMEDKKK